MPFPSGAPSADLSRCKILESRDQYRSCHIRVPDSEERMAAIVLGDRYYSFFRLVKDSQKALQIAAKLVYRGDEVAMTRTIKGDVIWIYESEAEEDKPKAIAKSRSTAAQMPLMSSGLWKFLASDHEYRPCQIRVPDVAKPMTAIYNDGQYYSHLRTVREQQQAIELVERLSSKGHAARITKHEQAWAIWVLESEASIQT
ncbi:hypothetical protein ACQ4M3_11820 [Leptolyngbya sp. AN03gr2]|uniref:hypothetical protein n=1 Tax=unclassified Leptolyngbya TaxID=2650499 RepID=UPI003D31741B